MQALNSQITDSLRHVYTVTHLNNEVRDLLEGSFPLIWVEGEISGFSAPSSGHWYLTLKDEGAQIRAAMFRMRNMHVGFKPRNGMQVLIRARVSLYAPRGDYQLIIEHMEEAGDGALRRAFDALKQRLGNEGLFSAEHKIALPPHPQRVGVVTSPTGAAIHDILTVLRRRAPGIEVILYPVAVQGNAAAAEIAAMITLADQRAECDVLIVGRGGGSLEDLWAFNEEPVARALFACQLPVISAVGHEVDVTIADFVADVRAATPSAAAELISPDHSTLRQRLEAISHRLHQRMQQRLKHTQQQLHWLTRRLQSPQQRLQHQAQRLDDMEAKLLRTHHILRLHLAQRLSRGLARLERHNPAQRIDATQQHLGYLQRRLHQTMHQQLDHHKHTLTAQARALDTVSPLATLHRGYAIIERPSDRAIITDTHQVAVGESIDARLANGRLRCTIDEVHHD